MTNSAFDDILDGRDPSDVNKFLRSSIEHILQEIEDDARRNALYPASKKENVARVSNHDRQSMQHELDRVKGRMLKIKQELKRSRQESCIRGVEDRMRSTRKEIDRVHSELDSLKETASRQQKVFDELNRGHLTVKELSAEVAKEKRLYQQLRKELNSKRTTCIQ
jgi:archaellum component FlaC